MLKMADLGAKRTYGLIIAKRQVLTQFVHSSFWHRTSQLRANVTKQGRSSGSRLNGKWRSAMTTVVATHAVGNMDTWLGGGAERKALFANFSSSDRIFRHTDANLVSIVWENVDLEKMKAMFSSSEAEAAEAAHTVVQPVEVYIEVEGGK